MRFMGLCSGNRQNCLFAYDEQKESWMKISISIKREAGDNFSNWKEWDKEVLRLLTKLVKDIRDENHSSLVGIAKNGDPKVESFWINS